MKEKKVNMTDMNWDAVKSLLEYVYRVHKVADASLLLDEQLLYAAHKYNILRLKMSCEDVLAASLKTEDASELLSIGYDYDAAQ